MTSKILIFTLILVFYNAYTLASCQPQCVAHARHSANIFTHRVGTSKGAIDWFRLAEKNGHTQTQPGVGKVKLPMAFAPQSGLNPRFGHVVFVKSSEIISSKRYLLHISQTNYAGRCRLEHTQAYFNAETMQVEFIDGFFKGKQFVAAGFINR